MNVNVYIADVSLVIIEEEVREMGVIVPEVVVKDVAAVPISTL